MLLNSHWVNEEIKEEIKEYMETNENENTRTPNLWDTMKAVIRVKFIAIQIHLKKQTKHLKNKNDPNLYLEELEKEQTESKVNRRKKIIEIRAKKLK